MNRISAGIDFIDVDFSDATLMHADLRASIYTRVNFSRSDLRGAGLRRTHFDGCNFDAAVMDGVILKRGRQSQLALSNAQSAKIDWREDDGPVPAGG